MSIARRAVRGTFWVAASSWVNRLGMVVVLAVLAGSLDAREFGLLAIATLAANVLLSMNDLGLHEALVFQQRREREAARTTLLLTTLFGAALAAILVLSVSAIADFYRVPDAAGIIKAFAFMVFCNSVGQAPKAVLTSDLDFRRRFVPEAVPGVLATIVTVVLAFIISPVWAFVIGEAVREASSAVLAFVVLPERFGPGWDREAASDLWHYGRTAILGGIMDFLLQNIDYLLVGRLLGPVALGFYALAFRIAILPFVTVTNVIAGVAFPSFARLMPDMDRVRSAFRSTFRLGCAIAVLLATGLVALAPSIEVLGAWWAPSIPTIRALGLYVGLRSAALLIGVLLLGIGRPGVYAALRALWLVLLAVLIATVGRRGIGTVGVVQAAVAGVLLVAHAIAARRLAGVPISGLARDLYPIVVASAAGGLTVAGLRAFGGVLTDDTGIVAFVALAVPLAIAYVVTLLALSPQVAADLRQVRTSISAE